LPAGVIQLQVLGELVPPQLWTVVQWQDGFGNWHDVKGWQGTLESGDRKTWWVLAADLSTGPVRWALYENPTGALIGLSESFYLPSFAGETILAKVSVMP
jgi:hypothetical protein